MKALVIESHESSDLFSFRMMLPVNFYSSSFPFFHSCFESTSGMFHHFCEFREAFHHSSFHILEMLPILTNSGFINIAVYITSCAPRWRGRDVLEMLHFVTTKIRHRREMLSLLLHHHGASSGTVVHHCGLNQHL